MNPIQTFSCIGAGHVASALSEAFCNAGLKPLSIWSRDPHKRQALAVRLGATAPDKIDQIDPLSDLILIAVSDDAIELMLPQLPPMKGIVAHCSGLKNIEILRKYGQFQTVIYPVQTFSEGHTPDLSQTPFCLEVSDATVKANVDNLIKKISSKVYWYSSQERARIHLSAVWANNFTNAMYRVASDLLREQGLPFDLLRPLILEGAIKCQSFSPENCQSGPAKRGDRRTMESHCASMPDSLRELYQTLSDLIGSQEQNVSFLNYGNASN